MPKVAQAQFPFGYLVLANDPARNQPKHHEPCDALQKEEHESGHTEGLKPLHCVIRGRKNRGGQTAQGRSTVALA